MIFVAIIASAIFKSFRGVLVFGLVASGFLTFIALGLASDRYGEVVWESFVFQFAVKFGTFLPFASLIYWIKRGISKRAAARKAAALDVAQPDVT